MYYVGTRRGGLGYRIRVQGAWSLELWHGVGWRVAQHSYRFSMHDRWVIFQFSMRNSNRSKRCSWELGPPVRAQNASHVT